ncbi:MAG: hypothetical protein IPM96_14105 [Ignavibacteria bacterium]|nr:hypothetical protein [Ignavibacteria bacterium]
MLCNRSEKRSELRFRKKTVCLKNRCGKNQVHIDDEESLYSSEFTVKDINLMTTDKLISPIKADVKIRYNGVGYSALLNNYQMMKY